MFFLWDLKLRSSCGYVSVDGGHDYLRRCFINSPADYTDLFITEASSDKDANNEKEI